MYYEIIKYLNNKKDLSSLMDLFIDYIEKHNKSKNLDKIKNVLIKYYLLRSNGQLKNQKMYDISNKICNYIQK